MTRQTTAHLFLIVFITGTYPVFWVSDKPSQPNFADQQSESSRRSAEQSTEGAQIETALLRSSSGAVTRLVSQRTPVK